MDIELRDIEVDELDELQALIESDPDYVQRVTGYPPGPADAQGLLMIRPPDLPEQDKRVLGAWSGDTLVGVVDLLRGFPTAEFVHVGLLEVRKDLQGQGVGTEIHHLVVQEVCRWAPAATTLRAAIVTPNAEHAEPFWRARGYAPAGAEQPYTYDKLHTTVRIWHRPIGGGSRPSE